MVPNAIQLWDFQVTEDNSAGRRFKLQEGSLSLGASPDCDMVSNAAGLAPRHAEFWGDDGALHVRVLDGAPPVLINGGTVLDSAEVFCPATVEIGVLRVFINRSSSTAVPGRRGDSTLRIVHPAGPHFAQFSDPDGLDVTGRIVCQLQDSEEAPAARTLSGAPDFQGEKTRASFSEESTMAFSLDSAELEISDKVPVRMDYEVKGEIARGGMGKIYSAEDAGLERLVALKLSTAAERGRDSQFFREAKVLAALAHPNIVPIHNLGIDAEGRPFYSMKLIQGRTLQWIIKQLSAGDLSISSVYTRERLLDVFRKVCDAVSFAHSKGYLHRDLKPENIMVGEFGEVLVMDWGLAKVIRKTPPEAGQAATRDAEPETLSYIEGTPQYMSPEQANGVYGGLDERSDIYSLGGVLYAILTHRPPVTGTSVAEVIQKVRAGETTVMAMPRRREAGAAPLRIEQTVPEALRAVTLKALSRDKTTRYQSVAAFAADIEAYQNGFATSAETAGVLRLFVLLMKRHRIASGFAAAFLVSAVVFTLGLAASVKQALVNERKALGEKATAQIALAGAAEQAQDAGQMQRALALVDMDFRDQEWRYLSLLAGAGDTPVDLKDCPPWINFEPHPQDADLLFALHDDGSIRTVNLAMGEVKDVVCAQSEAREGFKYFRLAISPTAGLAAVSAFDEKKKQMHVRVIDLKTNVKRPDFLFASTGSQHPYLQFDKNSAALVVSLNDPARIHVLDTADGALRWKWPKDEDKDKEKSSGVACLSADKSAVVLRREGRAPVEFSLATGAQQEQTSKDRFRIGLGQPENFAFPAEGKSIFSLSNGILRKFDTQSGEKVFDERLPNGAWQAGRRHPSSLSLFPHENIVVTLTQVSDDSAVILLHDGADGRVTRSRLMKTDRGNDPSRLVTHPLSKKVAVVRGNRMKVWSLAQPVPKAELSVLSYSDDGFSFLNSPATLVTTDTVRVDPDAKRGEASFKILNLKNAGPEADGVALHLTSAHAANGALYVIRNPGGNWLGAKFWGGRDLMVYKTEGGSLQEVRRLAVTENYWEIRFSPSGRLIWTTTGLFETNTGKHLETPRLDGESDRTERIPPVWIDESRMAQIRMVPRNKGRPDTINDRAIVAWKIKNAQRDMIVPAPDALWLDAAPDGSQLVEAGADMRVRLRDAATLGVNKTMRVHEGPVTAVAWHPSLPVIATASSDYSVKIWDLATETPLEEFRYLHNVMAKRLMWSPDGRMLAVSDTSDPRQRPNLKVYEPKSLQARMK
jgi:serine/threonine protein kinase/WD40 repeat protein